MKTYFKLIISSFFLSTDANSQQNVREEAIDVMVQSDTRISQQQHHLNGQHDQRTSI